MKQKENRVYALLFCILFCLAVAFFFDCYFDANDDATLRDILAGRYAGMPSGMAVYILFPLGWLLSLFYWVAPLIPWYGLFLCGCQFGCLYLLTERTLSFFEKNHIRQRY